jgi:recombination protein RecA
MDNTILKRLKNAGLLSEQLPDLGFVSTGSYALNKVISGDYKKGIPIGMITQIYGKSSTAKTVFVTHMLVEAQKKGYYSVLIDSENAYSVEFAESLGIDSKKLIYSTPDTLEDSFKSIEDIILAIRECDEETPIIVAYDSIAVSPSKVEFEADSYDGNNMQGAIRAKAAGACLRKINPFMRKHKVSLVIINQLREKVGIMYGDNTTAAGGGRALEYYIGVNLMTLSNKTSDLIKDENKKVIGIKGTVRNKKNKVSIPFKECEFELLFDKGLNKYEGALKFLIEDGEVEQTGAWYTITSNDTKFQKKDFISKLEDDTCGDFSGLRELFE